VLLVGRTAFSGYQGSASPFRARCLFRKYIGMCEEIVRTLAVAAFPPLVLRCSSVGLTVASEDDKLI
jgi:hypothetical protein